MKSKLLKASIIGCGILALSASPAFANEDNQGNFNSAEQQMGKHKFKQEGPHLEMIKAIESNDYDSWLKLMTEKHPEKIADFTQENFKKIVEIHQLMKSGDKEGAKKLMDELGLKMGPGHKGKFKPFKGEDIKKAIEANDYEQWLELMTKNHPEKSEKFTEELFNKLVEAHKLMEAGDKEAAKKILSEIRPKKLED